MAILKIVSFLEYLLFFRAVFCTEQLQYSYRIVFLMFLAFLIFDRNGPFCKGYSLCMGYSLCKMADFKNCLISAQCSVFFLCGLFAQNNSNVVVELFLTCFWHF